jgi:ABC-type uncharacterized transport system involved in gliding motility auxiliary subunit
MKFIQDRRKEIAPIAYLASLAVLMGAGAWYVVNREFDLVLTIALIVAALILTGAVVLDPERVRRAFVGRQAKYGSNALLMSLGILGILAVVNFLVYSNPKRWDLTEDQTYTLSNETLNILDEMTNEVQVSGYYTPDLSQSRDRTRTLLDQYRIRSDGKIDYEFINPLEYPFAADQAGVTRDGTLVLSTDDRSELVEAPTEQRITEALVRLLNPGERKVYFLTGHGERDFEGTSPTDFNQVGRALTVKNYEVEALNLLSLQEVPEDASVIVIAGPEAALSQEEVDLLAEFLNQGGAVVLLAEPDVGTERAEEGDPLNDYLSETWGIDIMSDFVVDLASQSSPFLGISNRYAVHPITDEISTLATIYPTVRSLQLPAAPEGVIQDALVLTGDRSWGETDYVSFVEEGVLEYDEGIDSRGPLTLAVAAENASIDARVVVFGDADFAANDYFFELGNGDMAIGSIDWAAGNEQLINLTPKQTTQRVISPPTTQTTGLIFLTTIVLIPGAVIVMGVSVWWQRRNRG